MDLIMSKKILSKNFYDLESYIRKKKYIYQSGKPYPHIVIKNYFDKNFLSKVLDEFPNLSKISSSKNYNNKNNKMIDFDVLRALLLFLVKNSQYFKSYCNFKIYYFYVH